MKIPQLILQAIVTFVLASAVVPLLVVAVPEMRDPKVGYATVACVFGGVLAVLRMIWPKRTS